METASAEAALVLRKIDKTYPENGIHACRSLSFEAHEGETLAIIGENGSGKSTLMKLLCGYLKADGGSIELWGQEQRFSSPSDALKAGIGMVHQHIRLIPSFTVLENLILGNEPTKRYGAIAKERARNHFCKLAEHYGIDLHPDKIAGGLNGAERQNISLLHLLSRDVRFIVLDEPNTVFEDEENEYVHRLIRRLNREGRTVFLVSHKIREAKQMASKILVLRHGKRAAFLDAQTSSLEEITSYILNSPRNKRKSKREEQSAPPISDAPLRLECRKISCRCEGFPGIEGIDIELRAGEILTLLGLRESGLETIEQLLSGRSKAVGGGLWLFGREEKEFSPERLRELKIAYIPSDRLGVGLSPNSSLTENLLLLQYKHYYHRLSYRSAKALGFVRNLIRKYRIEAAPQQRLDQLSGGNIQKSLIARELSEESSLLLFADPFWGLDIAAKRDVMEKLQETRDRGAAVLLLSSDIDEAIQVSDRIAVLHSGTLSRPLSQPRKQRDMIARLMIQGDDNDRPQA